MDRKLVGLVGVAAALAPAVAAASPASGPDDGAAASYADLLTPIPNAVEKLKASDALLRSEDVAATLEMAQYYYHHHHHHHFYRRFYHHHHHHNFYRRFRHHQHHHHNFYR